SAGFAAAKAAASRRTPNIATHEGPPPSCGGQAEGGRYKDERRALVAGDGFGGGFLGRCSAIATAIGWGDGYRLVGVGEVGRDRLGDVGYRADLHDGWLRLLQNELFVDGADFGLLFESLLAAEAVFFGSGHRDVVFDVAHASGVVRVNDERVLIGAEVDALTFGVDFMLAVVLVPLGHGRVLVHVLDDLAPADAGVVGTEADFALLRAVGDDAHFGAAEVVVEEILEPHPRDEQEVPGILRAALHGVFVGALGRSLAILGCGTLGKRPSLIKFLEEVVQLQALGTFKGLVVLQEGHGHHEVGEALAAGGIGDCGDIRGELLRVEEARNGGPFLGFLVDHDGGTHAAIGVAAAGERTPLGFVALDHVRETREGADKGDGKPITIRLDAANLLTHIVGEVRKGVALAEAPLGRNVFIAAGKGNRLEADEGDFLGVLHRELDDGADLIVVHVVNDGHNEDDFDAGLVHVLDGAQLDVEEVADLAMAVGVVADAVELEVGVAQPGFKGLLAILLALGEFDAVGGGLHGVVADLARVADGVEEIRAHGGLAAGELHGHLAARLDLRRVIQDFGDFFPGKFVDVADLVGVHEAGIAHHVAAVGQVHGENGAPAIADIRRAVPVLALVVVRRDIAAGELRFNPLKEAGVHGHEVFIMAVLRAVLDHPDLAIALDDLRFDFADLFMSEVAPIFRATDDGLAGCFHAGRAERIRLSREAQRWLGPFPGFQERFIGPLWGNGRVGIAFVEILNGIEGDTRRFANEPVH